ncbi:hypothetical protein L1887_40730 [Cichorium endivia]|nr:hypothetical protein L1887_40730 [Cichorium endivia]
MMMMMISSTLMELLIRFLLKSDQMIQKLLLLQNGLIRFLLILVSGCFRGFDFRVLDRGDENGLVSASVLDENGVVSAIVLDENGLVSANSCSRVSNWDSEPTTIDGSRFAFQFVVGDIGVLFSELRNFLRK